MLLAIQETYLEAQHDAYLRWEKSNFTDNDVYTTYRARLSAQDLADRFNLNKKVVQATLKSIGDWMPLKSKHFGWMLSEWHNGLETKESKETYNAIWNLLFYDEVGLSNYLRCKHFDHYTILSFLATEHTLKRIEVLIDFKAEEEYTHFTNEFWIYNITAEYYGFDTDYLDWGEPLRLHIALPERVIEIAKTHFNALVHEISSETVEDVD